MEMTLYLFLNWHSLIFGNICAIFVFRMKMSRIEVFTWPLSDQELVLGCISVFIPVLLSLFAVVVL